MITCNRLVSALLLAIGTVPVYAADHPFGINSRWGQSMTPDGDCSFMIRRNDPGALTIKFSGAIHGLEAEVGRMNAPRVLKSIDGDFAVQVTVDGNLPLPDNRTVTAYVSGGLLLMKDDRNYIRLERASFTRPGVINHYVNFEQRIDAKRTRMGLFRDYPLSNDQPVDLRLEVKSGIVRALARRTGQPWHEIGTAKADTDSTFSVGISGVNTSRQPLEVTFRNIQHQHEFVAVDNESSSGIDLASPP